MIVVLPEPLGPSKPMISPFSTLKETWLTARVAPKYLVRSWTSIMKPAFALLVLRGEIPRSHGHERGCLHGSQFIAIAPDRKDAIQRAFWNVGARKSIRYFRTSHWWRSRRGDSYLQTGRE